MQIPGGQIIGGMGGRLWFGPFGLDQNSFNGKQGSNNPYLNGNGSSQGPYSMEVAQWMLLRLYELAECPHTGLWGAMGRRLVGYDFRFAASMPLDQANMPDYALEPPLTGTAADVNDASSQWINISLALYLGDVVENPEAVGMQMTQRFYYAPSAYLQQGHIILNAAGDVIRANVAGLGNSRIFLLPDEIISCAAYVSYLRGRNWWV